MPKFGNVTQTEMISHNGYVYFLATERGDIIEGKRSAIGMCWDGLAVLYLPNGTNQVSADVDGILDWLETEEIHRDPVCYKKCLIVAEALRKSEGRQMTPQPFVQDNPAHHWFKSNLHRFSHPVCDNEI